MDFTERLMSAISKEIKKAVVVEDYEIKVKVGLGPLVYVTIEGASEDTTTARKVRNKIEKIMDAAIKNHTKVPGFSAKVRTYNRGKDLLVECEVIFP